MIVQVEKNVFVAFFSGERAKNKILKMCEAFGANRYPFPEDLSKQVQAIAEVHVIPYVRFDITCLNIYHAISLVLDYI